jgi:hypothetical protein
MQAQTRMETIKVEGSQLLDKVKQLLHEGNVRHIAIKQDGRTIVEFPLTVGVVGVVLAPVLAAVGALAALLAECSIEVERAENAPAAADTLDEQVVEEPDMATLAMP